MARRTKGIPAGRNDPRVHQEHVKGAKKSNARDIAMRAGDLRNQTGKSKNRFNRKRPSLSEISAGSEPFPILDDKESLGRTNALRNKLTAQVAALKKAA